MMGSLILKVFFAGLCYLTLLAYAAPAASVSSSASGGSGSPSNSSSGYCMQFLDEVNVYQGPWFQGMGQSLSAFCSSSWCNSLSELTPQTTTYESPIYPPKYQPPSATITTGPTETEVTQISYSTLPSFVSPCCGQCDITAVSISGAQVLYWPTPAPQPPVKSVVDSTGFTYMSPSVYVVFNSLVAHDNCGVVGSVQPDFTTSFGPNDLSTVSGGSAAYYTLPFNYGDLSDCFTSFVTSTYTKDFDSTDLYTTVIPDWETPAVYNLWTSKSSRCYPKVAVESWVTDLDPAWKSCTAGANYVGIGVPIVYAAPQPLVGVDGLYNPITTEPTPMTKTSAAPSGYYQSFATSTRTASAAPESTTPAGEKSNSAATESTSTTMESAATASAKTEGPTTESTTTAGEMTESTAAESPTTESTSTPTSSAATEKPSTTTPIESTPTSSAATETTTISTPFKNSTTQSVPTESPTTSTPIESTPTSSAVTESTFTSTPVESSTTESAATESTSTSTPIESTPISTPIESTPTSSAATESPTTSTPIESTPASSAATESTFTSTPIESSTTESAATESASTSTPIESTPISTPIESTPASSAATESTPTSTPIESTPPSSATTESTPTSTPIESTPTTSTTTPEPSPILTVTVTVTASACGN